MLRDGKKSILGKPKWGNKHSLGGSKALFAPFPVATALSTTANFYSIIQIYTGRFFLSFFRIKYSLERISRKTGNLNLLINLLIPNAAHVCRGVAEAYTALSSKLSYVI